MDREEIQAWIAEHEQDMLRDLDRICRIRSVANPEETERPPYGEGCLRVLDEMLTIGRENGFETYNYDNYVGRITCPGKTKHNIGIWAHLDVVDEGEGWLLTAPYEPILRDGYYIARGCQDNKSSAIIGLYTLKYFREHGIVPEHTLELYLGTCEEQGMYDLDYFTAHYDCPELSLVPDSGFPACCGERGFFNASLTARDKASPELLELICDCGLNTIPDKASVTYRYRESMAGLCMQAPQGITVQPEPLKGCMMITAHGISSQAANPDKGVNALSLLADYLCESGIAIGPEGKFFEMIREINAKHDGSALEIATGDEMSGPMLLVATTARLEQGYPVMGLSARYPFSTNDFPYEDRAAQTAGEKGFVFTITEFRKAAYFDPERPEAKLLTEVSNEVLGRDDKAFVMSGGTYARKLPNAFAFGTGMPLPPAPEGLFAPGHGDYHQPDESISLERIRKGLEVYICGMLKLCEFCKTP